MLLSLINLDNFQSNNKIIQVWFVAFRELGIAIS